MSAFARAKGGTLLCCSNLPISRFPADGGETRYPASNLLILYQFDMLHDLINAGMSFSAGLDHFRGSAATGRTLQHLHFWAI
jgi:hypothetical protein